MTLAGATVGGVGRAARSSIMTEVADTGSRSRAAPLKLGGVAKTLYGVKERRTLSMSTMYCFIVVVRLEVDGELDAEDRKWLVQGTVCCREG